MRDRALRLCGYVVPVVVFLLLLLLSTTCVNDRSYRIDGVPVVLRGGVGPSKPEMALTSDLYRREARNFFGLSIELDREIWRSINRIEWTGEFVSPNGGRYDIESRKIKLQWKKCVFTSKLFWVLTEHYGWTDDSDDWVHDLVVEGVPPDCG